MISLIITHAPLKVSVDKALDITVHDLIHLSHLIVCSVILNHGVRGENVGTNLAPPGDFFFIPFKGVDLSSFFLLL
ncbi:Uncharacterised protein [Chlamydia trachomatis]|nr:Uncharacterised protein [Chlamydia trachomatis]